MGGWLAGWLGGWLAAWLIGRMGEWMDGLRVRVGVSVGGWLRV